MGKEVKPFSVASVKRYLKETGQSETTGEVYLAVGSRIEVYRPLDNKCRVFQTKSEKHKAVTASVLRFVIQPIRHIKEKHFKIFCSNFWLPGRAITIILGPKSIF